MSQDKHKHLQHIPKDLNEKLDEKLKESIAPSKTWVINQLITMWVNDDIKINFKNYK